MYIIAKRFCHQTIPNPMSWFVRLCQIVAGLMDSEVSFIPFILRKITLK